MENKVNLSKKEDSYVEYTNDEVVIHCNSDFLDIVNIGTTQEY